MFTAAKAFWPTTSLGKANLALFVLLGALVAVFHGELRWAWRELPNYLEGRIDSPPERQLYLQARSLLESKRPQAALALLDRSIAIDPNTEAAFLRAKALAMQGRLKLAAVEYERFLAVDYLHVQARLDLVRLYRQLGELERARATVTQGARIFSAMAKAYKPRVDPTVRKIFNQKAIMVYIGYAKAAQGFARMAETPDVLGSE